MILFVAMGRGTTRRSPSDLTPSLLGIPYFIIYFASLSMILFVIKKRIFAKYQPLNLYSLTKPSPSPGAPQISAQPEPTPPRVSPASPSTAGEAKPQQQHDTPSAQRGRRSPSRRGSTQHPADRPGDADPSPATRRQPSRHRQPVRSSQPPTVSKEQQPRHRPAETDGDRDGERERERSDRITHSFSASAHRRRTPAYRQRPQPQPTPGELDARSRPRLPPGLPAPPPFHFCFWRVCRTGARKPRKNTGERRPPPSRRRPPEEGGAFTFRTSALITDKHPVPSSSHLNPKNQFGSPFGLTSVQTRSLDHLPYTPNGGSFRHFYQIIFS